MRHVSAVLLVGSLAIGCATSDPNDASDNETPMQKRCTDLREHVIDLRLQAIGSGEDIAAHRKAFEQTLGTKYVEGCVSSLSIAQVQCAMAAGDPTKVSVCIAPDRKPATPVAHATATAKK